jgi:threonine dehydrogenase-like Zn-dependent dehydrogenase
MNDGANCGVSFGAEERWLVVAHLEGGHLRTNGCLPNRPIDGGDPEVDAVVDAMLPVAASAPAAEPAEFSLGGPAIVVVLGIGAIGVASLLAFRRTRLR